MNAKTVSLVITFAALAIVLNPAISGIGLPYPLLPGMVFQIWEIPTVAAFLLFGLSVGLSVAAINSVFLLAVYPGMAQPWYWFGSLISVSSMMLGFLLAQRLIDRLFPNHRPSSKAKMFTVSLASSILFRVVCMAPVMVAILSFLTYPSIPVLGVVYFVLPWQAIFNIIVPLYMVPAGYLIAMIVSRNLRVGNTLI